MGRKRPPGARAKAPTTARSHGEWGNDAAAAMTRIMGAVPLVECAADHAPEVLAEAQRFFDQGAWDPPLERFSLMVQDGIDGPSTLKGYRLREGAADLLVHFLETHEQAATWEVTGCLPELEAS